jgi:hypothetical protein
MAAGQKVNPFKKAKTVKPTIVIIPIIILNKEAKESLIFGEISLICVDPIIKKGSIAIINMVKFDNEPIGLKLGVFVNSIGNIKIFNNCRIEKEIIKEAETINAQKIFLIFFKSILLTSK